MNGGWGDIDWDGWVDVTLVREMLAAGADPDHIFEFEGPVLHVVAEHGTPVVVAEVAARVHDIDAAYQGRTALWQCVFADRPDNARVLLTAGSSAWRPMMSGWSPGRLSLAGPTPDLFGPVPEGIGLSHEEAASVAEAWRLRSVLPGPDVEGMSVACTGGVDVAEAILRLRAGPVEGVDFEQLLADPDGYGLDTARLLTIVGATDVPGGCLLVQPWSYGASRPGLVTALSKGTVCYAFHADQKGDRGTVARDGVPQDWDLTPGTTAPPLGDAASSEVLRTYLHQNDPCGYACAYAGVRPEDARAVTGPPDVWLQLTPGSHWD